MPERATPPKFDAEDRLDHDVTCVDCGYNLRGRRNADSCPECGLTVSLSTVSRFLLNSDANRFVAIRSGAHWFMWGLCLFATLPVTCPVVGGLTYFLTRVMVGPNHAGTVARAALALVVGGVLCVFVIGCFRLVASRQARRINAVAVPVLRAASLLCTGAVASLAATLVGAPRPAALSSATVQLNAILLILCANTAIIAAIAIMADLADRMPNRRLSRSLRVLYVPWGVSWMASALFLGLHAAGFVLGTARPFGTPPSFLAAWCFVPVALFVTAYFTAMAVVRLAAELAVLEERLQSHHLRRD